MSRAARCAAVLVAALWLAAAAPAHAAEPPPGSVWEEHYFPSGDGTSLHADVLRPAHLPKDARTPVLLTVSPYLNHADSGGGPSDRFYDFLELSGALKKGYTYVMVDLRGFGGSGGCNDWGGPGERMDAKVAVEWAASQPWSTGRVGMLGKSYDGWTGLMAIAERPKGLAAVLSMEPVYSGYRYLYSDGVRFLNSLATPLLFQAYDARPGAPSDTVQYQVNGTGPNGPCYAANIGQQQLDDPTHEFWLARDLLVPARGATTPLFLTQGYLET
ncbi:MAG: CocE/NonD family hydrolase, partial [Actinomycetes bacterium]